MCRFVEIFRILKKSDMRKVTLVINLILAAICLVPVVPALSAVPYPEKTLNTSELKVYPPLPGNQYMSDRYEVKVTMKGVSQNSYVYKDPNNDSRWFTKWQTKEAFMTLENHFTTFSFLGKVIVQIKLPQRKSISSVIVRPLSKKLKAKIKGNTISIPLSGPANFFVEIDGEKRYPLFVFANPPETNIPSPRDTNVIYFGPGIHEIGYKDGPMQKIALGKTVYLAGGAYVKGVLKTKGDSGTTVVRGRGILSGIDIPGYSAYNGMIEVRPGTVRVEGIILVDSPQGYQGIISWGKGSVVENVKILSWAMESDAGSLGANSQITNCFYKLNDDIIKPTQPGMLFKDNIVWQQVNGSVILLGWNGKTQGINAIVSGLDIIGCDVGGYANTTNAVQGIINLKNSNGATYKGMIFENIRIEKKPYRLIGIAIKQTDPGWTDNPHYNLGLGSVDGMIFRNISMPEVPVRPSIFNGNGNVTAESTGDIKNITFENITIGGISLTGQNADSYITRIGNTSNFIYK